MGFLCCPPKHLLQPLCSLQHLPSCSILLGVEIPQRLMLQPLLEDSGSHGKPRIASKVRIHTCWRAQKGKRKFKGLLFEGLFSHSWNFWQFPQELGWQRVPGGNAQCRSLEQGNNLELEMQTQQQVRWQQSKEVRSPQRGLGYRHAPSPLTHHWQRGCHQ